MAIPGLFKPVTYHGRVLIDGGVTNPVPTDVVKQMGADVVIGVNLDLIPEGAEDEGTSHIPLGMMEVANRTIDIMRHYLASSCNRSADIVVEPLVETYASWTHYFRKDVGHEIVVAGEVATEKIIPELKTLLSE